MKRKAKRASISLKNVDLQSRATVEAHLEAKSRDKFLKLAADWWDRYGTHYCDFREFHAEMASEEGA